MNGGKLPTRRDCFALLGALSMSSSLAARQRSWPGVQRALDELVRERFACGLVLGLSYGGHDAQYPHSGTIAFDSTRAFDADSICRLYSITKNVTRIATLMLAEDGKITLDQPVVDYLPEFRNLRVAVDPAKGLDSRPAEKVMTIRHLVTNTSGLGNWTPGSDSGEELHRFYRERGITPGNYGAGLKRAGYGPQATSMEEMVRRVAELPLAYEPGTVLHYSIGFDVMALVIERVTGKPYARFLSERLWDPLDMASTGFQVNAKDAKRLTTNYDATERGPPDPTPDSRLPAKWTVTDDRATSDWLEPPALLAGGGGLVSTARDFLRYSRMLLGDGKLGTIRVMKTDTARLATGDIQPPGIAEPDDTVGAGSRSLLRTPMLPAGTTGSAGATGTLFWIDRARKGAAVFLVQAMYGAPVRSPFQKRLFPALDQDLAAR